MERRHNTALLMAALVVVSLGASASATFNDSYYFLGRRFMPRLHRHRALSREFLQAHNVVRQGMNEPTLMWDRRLARYARRWAAKRVFDCKMIHSYGPYGENIFWGGQDHWTATQAVESWVTEKDYYNPDTNECVPGQMCGHYTQVVWRESVRVGCSRTRCLNGGLLIYCEYDPPGNYVNENPFGRVFDQVVQTLSGSPDSNPNPSSSSSSSLPQPSQSSSSATPPPPKYSPDLLR